MYSAPMVQDIDFDVIVLGAGAAGLMAAGVAGARGRRVLVLDHAKKPGEKIRISGGGRCNFTNLHCAPDSFISDNPHFCKSALKRYTQHDFIAMVDRYKIAWHEKTLGQLFCDDSAQQIIDMLLSECEKSGVAIQMDTNISAVDKQGDVFTVTTGHRRLTAHAVVVATGGPSIPKMGATGFAYDIARQFGMRVVTPRAALVPLTFDVDVLAATKPLSGLAVDPARVHCNGAVFDEALLFTHKGISGPAILQISSYWRGGDTVRIDLAPGLDVLAHLKDMRMSQPKKHIHSILGDIMPQRLADVIVERTGVNGPMADLSDKKLSAVSTAIQAWDVIPCGTEGYRTAEVAAGGVDTKDLSSKTMESQTTPGLYFIGEAVDVTGWLGGYNFQWAWSSGHACGQAL